MKDFFISHNKMAFWNKCLSVCLSCEPYRSVSYLRESSPCFSCCQIHLTSNSHSLLCINFWTECTSDLFLLLQWSVYAPHSICVNQLIGRCALVQPVAAGEDYYGSVWTVCTALQLSENVGNPWGKLTPTFNCRLALTASLSPHQLPSH